MLNILIDQQEVKQLYLQKLEERIKEVDTEMVFWDANELKRRTCMSWNTIQEKFFLTKGLPSTKLEGSGISLLIKQKNSYLHG